MATEGYRGLVSGARAMYVVDAALSCSAAR